MAEEVGYYTLPVILSFEGIEKQANATLSKSLGGAKIGKSFGKDIADGIKSTEADVKRALDSYSKLYDKAADQADKLKVAQAGIADLEKRGITSGQRWERAQAAKSKATRDHERALREARNAYEDYERSAKDAQDAEDGIGGGLLDRLKGLGSSAAASGQDAATGFVEGFGGPIAALGTKAGPIGLALAAAAGLGLGAGVLIGKQVMAGLEREAQADRIAAQLGLNEADSRAFAESAGEVYADAFGESLGDVQQSMADVASTFTTESADAVEDLTAKALTFRDVFGTDVAESVAAAQNLIVNGLARNGNEAFDLLAASFQRVPAAMRDELPEVLSEYSTYFQSLGFSGEEAFGMLVATAPRGKIALDKLGDSLKEFTLLATDLGAKPVQDAFSAMGLSGQDVANNLLAGGSRAQEQFKQVVDGLLAIPDPAEQAQAAVALFGTPLEDLDKSKIPEFLKSLDDAGASMQGFAGSSQRMVDTVGGNAATTIEGAKRSIEEAVGGMQSSLAEAFGPTVQQLAGFISQHEDQIVSFFKTAANAGAEFGSAITLTIGGTITMFGQFVAAIGDTSGWILDGFEAMVGGAATVADAFGFDGLAGDLRGAQETLGGLSDDFHGWGEDLVQFGNSITNAGIQLHDFDSKTVSTKQNAELAAANIERISNAMGALPGGKEIDISAIVTFKDTSGNVVPPSQLRTPAFIPAVPGETRPPRGGGRAEGGPIFGPGGPKSDIIPIWASNDEHMWTAEEVDAVGGHGAMYRMRALARAGAFGHFAEGGAVGLDALYAAAQDLVGTPYSMATRDDCSGTIAQLVNAALGLPQKSDLMSTATAAKWLPARGAILGEGPPGTFRIGWKNGGPGGGHMAATLPDGTNVEMGGANGGYTLGGNAAGADDPSFTDHAYFPVEALYPDGKPTGSIAAALGYSTGSTSGTGGGAGASGGAGGAGTYEVDQGAVADAEARVAEADARVREAEAKQRELEADAKESEKIRAQADVDKAKADADSARRELQEARRGKFVPAAGGKETGSGPGQLDPLRELVSIFGGGLLETLGMDGSWLPDLQSLMPIQVADTLLNSLVPAFAQAHGSGDVGTVPAGQTSGMPFGIPDVVAPPMPPPGQHIGSGMAPGPAPNVTYDLSTTYQGTVGMDPDALAKQNERAQSRGIARLGAIPHRP